jgi:carboxylesterase
MKSNVTMMPVAALGRHGTFTKRGKVGVLLVHGITGSPTEMKPLARKLAAEGFTVACPQLAGHCSTLKELKMTRWTDWYASLEAGLDFLSGECDRVYVAGLSMGALLSLKLAADHPDRIHGVATLSVTFFFDGWNVPHMKQRFLLPLVIYSPLRHLLSYHEPAPYGIKDERIRNLIAKLYEGNSANMPEKYGYLEFPGVTIRETFRLIRSTKRDLARIVTPLLIVHSIEDDMASLENAKFLAARVSSRHVETFYLNDTYHVLTLDKRKEDVANRVSEFFLRDEAVADESMIPSSVSA